MAAAPQQGSDRRLPPANRQSVLFTEAPVRLGIRRLRLGQRHCDASLVLLLGNEAAAGEIIGPGSG